ncbi:hypothetical protein [Psychroserpens sp. SPM9]|uniref:hypothetical protein n=1 Tax=Psychroserpens sp. SPM9 TaxID=2975598 RepID=UPI0021A6CEC9|nr:hypothetical protein [Psychroserpens sp. SPM9]MDG5491430.1 hypothetical protein [Psychroserpens sp. SPM9]
MKKYSLLFCLFMLLCAFTCENEPLEGDFTNENTDTNPSSLLGTWSLVEFNADIISESSFAGQEFIVDFTTEAVSSDYELVFSESSYTVEGDYELMSSTTVDGETTSYTDSYTNVSGSGVYSTSGNIMTIDGSFFELDIEGSPTEVAQGEQMAEFELSADGQTLTFFQDEVQIEDESGFVVTISTVSSSVWQKTL